MANGSPMTFICTIIIRRYVTVNHCSTKQFNLTRSYNAMKRIYLLLILFVPAHIFSQTLKAMNKPTYLDRNDSIFIVIKGHVVTDLQSSSKKADRNSAEGKKKADEMNSWDEEKRKRFERLFEITITNYVKKVNIDLDVFMLMFPELGNYNDTVIGSFDIRVRASGAKDYVAEFWEDGLTVNSEANALVWARKLIERFPGDDSTATINTVRATYAKARKAITDGKQPRYRKVIAVLYTKEKEQITFMDPFQSLMHFR
jgi:hypothetical protein